MKFLLISACFILVACSESAVDITQDYVERVSRVTGEEIPQLPQSSQTHLHYGVQVKRNAFELAATHISLIDFLKLQSCSLATTIGQKNSQLGKVAAASQQMHLERDFLLYGPQCITQLQSSDPELAQQLEQALLLKQQQAMKVWWNAWFSSAEWQAYISGSGEAIEHGEETPGHLNAGIAALDFSLRQGQAWSRQQFSYDSGVMELQLQQLFLAESISRWRNSLRWLSQGLSQSAAMLELTQQKKRLCRGGVEKKQAAYLRNVFNRIYVARIQPYLGRVYRFGNELMPRLQQVMELQPQADQFRHWLEQLQWEKQRFEQLNLRHVKAWQQWLAECGQSPGGAR